MDQRRGDVLCAIPSAQRRISAEINPPDVSRAVADTRIQLVGFASANNHRPQAASRTKRGDRRGNLCYLVAGFLKQILASVLLLGADFVAVYGVFELVPQIAAGSHRVLF